MWVSVLIMAETWGTTPWEIVERRGAIKWFRRFSILQTARSKRAKQDANKAKNKARRR